MGRKRQRKSITLEEKLDVIRSYNHNGDTHIHYTVDIANVMAIPKLTLRTTRN
jgi:hypothetical protein